MFDLYFTHQKRLVYDIHQKVKEVMPLFNSNCEWSWIAVLLNFGWSWITNLETQRSPFLSINSEWKYITFGDPKIILTKFHAIGQRLIKFDKYSYKKVIKKVLNKPLPSAALKVKVVYLPLKLTLNKEIIQMQLWPTSS